MEQIFYFCIGYAISGLLPRKYQLWLEGHLIGYDSVMATRVSAIHECLFAIFLTKYVALGFAWQGATTQRNVFIILGVFMMVEALLRLAMTKALQRGLGILAFFIVDNLIRGVVNLIQRQTRKT